MGLYDENVDVAGWIKDNRERLADNKRKILEVAHKEIKKREREFVLGAFTYVYSQMEGDVYHKPGIFIKKNEDGTITGKIIDYYFYSVDNSPHNVEFLKVFDVKPGVATSEPLLGMNVYLVHDGWNVELGKNKKIKKIIDGEKQEWALGRISLNLDEFLMAENNPKGVLEIKRNKVDKMFKETDYGKIDKMISEYKENRKVAR